MTYLLTKLCFSIFEVLIDLFIKMFNIFIEKPALFDSTKFEPIRCVPLRGKRFPLRQAAVESKRPYPYLDETAHRAY